MATQAQTTGEDDTLIEAAADTSGAVATAPRRTATVYRPMPETEPEAWA